MIKVVTLLTRKPGMTRQAFIDYESQRSAKNTWADTR